MSAYRHPALKQLADQQVRFVPPPRRLEQLQRAERLLAEVAGGKEYPYQYVCYRVTDYRPDAYPDLLIGSEDLRNDLGLMISDLAGSLPAIPVEEVPEPVLTLEQISEKLNVSTKTINRWRKRGLIGLPVLHNGRRQVGFFPSVVGPFLDENKERLAHSGQFSQLSEEEKEEILRRARRLSRVGGSTLTEVSRRIARRLGRSAETVRYTIKNFDRDHPEQALFPDGHRTAGRRYQAGDLQLLPKGDYRGHPSQTLPADPHLHVPRHQRGPRPAAAGSAARLHLPRVLRRPGAGGGDPGPDAGRGRLRGRSAAPMHVPKDAPPELASLYEMPLLSKEQEAAPVPQDELPQAQGRQGSASMLGRRARARTAGLWTRIEELQNEANDDQGPCSSTATCGWWCRSPSGTPARPTTSSSCCPTATCR